MHHLPSLPQLTAQQASDLEQVVVAGIIHLTNKAAAARNNLRKAIDGQASNRWADGHRAELAATERLIESARRFEASAHNRARAARQNECIAVRMIQAFAIAAMRAPAMAVAA